MNSLGVKYFGTWQDFSGYGDANRNFIAALYISGLDITTELIHQVGEKTDFGWIGALCRNLQDRQIDYKIKFLHTTPDLSLKYQEPGKYHIQHLFWECDRLPKEWINPCNQFEEIWTASEKQAQMIKDSGVTVPIRWFPQPLDSSLADHGYKPFVIPNFDGFIFYGIFQWILRKNPEAMVKTYLKTFEGKEDVCLALKTYGNNYSDKEFERILIDINKWKKELNQKHYPRIYLVNKLLSTPDMFRLHKAGNAFISTSCGEGWGRPIVEAALMGNPVISTDTTGFADYFPKEIYYPVPAEEVGAIQVPSIPWYTSEMRWLDIDRTKLKEAMLEVYEDRKESKRRGKLAQKFVKENFDYWTIGQAMKERITEIYKFL